MRSSVLLPQPEGPSRLTNSPRATDRSTPPSASSPEAKRLVTPRKATTGAGSDGGWSRDKGIAVDCGKGATGRRAARKRAAAPDGARLEAFVKALVESDRADNAGEILSAAGDGTVSRQLSGW